MATDRSDIPSCPTCGRTPTPIVYGLPARVAAARADRGEIVLGGCCIGPGSPKWACTSCGARFGDIYPEMV
ncbi:hypothetical protein [Nocardia sp. IFM 10818]